MEMNPVVHRILKHVHEPNVRSALAQLASDLRQCHSAVYKQLYSLDTNTGPHVPMHGHAYTHGNAHVCAHVYAHAYTHVRGRRIYARINAYVCKHVCRNAHTHACTHV